MKRKGFTLIELVVVIALIAILAVTLAPRLRDQIAKAGDAKAIAVLGSLRTASEVYFADNQAAPYGTATPAAQTSGQNAATNADQTGLALIIPSLDATAQKLFGAEDGTWETADGYAVEIGGRKSNSNDDRPLYGGSIEFTFSGPISTGDGISIWFTQETSSPDGVAFDTKGTAWASY